MKWALTLSIVTCVVADLWPAPVPDKTELKGGIQLVLEAPPQPLTNLGDGSLCREAPAKGGAFTQTDKTISELLGSEVLKIRVHYAAKELGELAQVKEDLDRLLASKPMDRTIYRYQAWAEAVPKKSIIATIDYKNQTKGALQIAGVTRPGAPGFLGLGPTVVYLCFQDQAGNHWWTRIRQVPMAREK